LLRISEQISNIYLIFEKAKADNEK